MSDCIGEGASWDSFDEKGEKQREREYKIHVAKRIAGFKKRAAAEHTNKDDKTYNLAALMKAYGKDLTLRDSARKLIRKSKCAYRGDPFEGLFANMNTPEDVIAYAFAYSAKNIFNKTGATADPLEGMYVCYRQYVGCTRWIPLEDDKWKLNTNIDPNAKGNKAVYDGAVDFLVSEHKVERQPSTPSP